MSRIENYERSDRMGPHEGITSLDLLGNELERAARVSLASEPKRAPRSWGFVLAPALAVVAALALFSLQLSPTAEATVVQAADHSAAVSAGAFTMTTRINGNATAGTGPIEFSTQGVYDRTTGRQRATIDLSKMLGSATGPGASAAVPGIGGSVSSIQDGPTLYLASELFTSRLPGNPPWVKVDTAQLDPSSPLAGGSDLELGTSDPGSFLQALRGIGDDTHVVEHTVIDGRVVTRYHGTVDLARAAGDLPAASRAKVEQSFAGLGLDPGRATMPTDVWVDADGNVLRISTELTQQTTTGLTGGTPGSTIQVTIDFRDLGTPVDIPLPPADQTVDITPLVNTALGGLLTTVPGSN